jgi:cell division septum initiation protein DivIVA
MKDRVKVMLNGNATPNNTTSERPVVAPHPAMPQQALQVLTMAQRTAEEHLNNAHRQAEKIHADAAAAAEQIARDAEIHAQNVRREAAQVLADARATAEQAARHAQARMEEVQRNADKIVTDVRAQADAIMANAEQNAEELKLQAQRRYDEVVGSLGVRREALQQQIEALERFDREYRGRLTAFMQSQLRALWVGQPEVTGEAGFAEDRDTEVPDESRLAEHRGPEPPNGFVPAQRQAPESDPEPAMSDD